MPALNLLGFARLNVHTDFLSATTIGKKPVHSMCYSVYASLQEVSLGDWFSVSRKGGIKIPQ